MSAGTLRKKMFSRRIELLVIRTITVEPDSRATQDLLAKLDESHFASETARVAFRRIRTGLKRNSNPPSWDDLISDPALDDTVREELEECKLRPLRKKLRTREAIDRLLEYKKLRLLSKIGRRISDVLNSPEPVVADTEIAEIQNTLAQSRSAKNFKVLRIGVNSNVMKHVDRMLRGQAITYLPTGFEGFDGVNRGIPDGAFMLLGAPTGAGKSLLLNQLFENFAKSGAKVGISPLEMSNDEMLQRNMARVGQVDMTKLLDPVKKLSLEEHKTIRKGFDRYDKKIAAAGGALEFYEFDEDVTIETLTSTVKPFELDALGIDYLGLLDGMNGDDQWRALMNAARYCHVWGKANNTRTVAACQLSEDGMLRYAKGMGEHAKFFWTFTVDEIAKSTGIIEITQRKARQASDHSFPLSMNWATQTVVDADKDAMEQVREKRKSSRGDDDGKGGKGKKGWKKDKSISWEDEDDDGPLPEPRPGPRAQKGGGGKRSSAPSREIEL